MPVGNDAAVSAMPRRLPCQQRTRSAPRRNFARRTPWLHVGL